MSSRKMRVGLASFAALGLAGSAWVSTLWAQARQGQTGDTGRTGYMGHTGHMGRTGDTGNTGYMGGMSDTGDTGRMGGMGATGDTGRTGSAGQGQVERSDRSGGAMGREGSQQSATFTGKLMDLYAFLTNESGSDWQSGRSSGLGAGNTGDTGRTGAMGGLGLTGDTGQTGAAGMSARGIAGRAAGQLMGPLVLVIDEGSMSGSGRNTGGTSGLTGSDMGNTGSTGMTGASGRTSGNENATGGTSGSDRSGSLAGGQSEQNRAYILVSGPGYETHFQTARGLAGERVRVTGRHVERDGIHAIVIDKLQRADRTAVGTSD